MSQSFHTIVVGLGAMGSSTLFQLAKRNIKVLGIDRLSPPHTFGSTHGDTRITRQAIGEGEHYTPLSLRSYELFRELEQHSKRKLLEITGGLIISDAAQTPDRKTKQHTPAFFENTLKAAKNFGIRHEVLSASDIRSRFPQFNVSDNEVGYFEYEAALLRPELIVGTQIEAAKELGADIHLDEVVLHFEERNDSVFVRTNKAEYCCKRLVMSVGPWLPEVFPTLAPMFRIQREVLFWFDVADAYDGFTIGKFPIFIWQKDEHEKGIYGFPAVDGPQGGFKIAAENYHGNVTPDNVDRTVSGEETAKMYKEYVAPFFPKANDRCVKSVVCLYTVTPDSAFVIDWLPASKNVIVCSPCSGHGFKHSAAIGECVAQLVTDGTSKLNIDAFAFQRLLSKTHP